MQNSNWMQEIYKDLQASLNVDATANIWVNITEKHFDLKTKLMNAVASNGKITKDGINRRERLLIRKLLWTTGLWKLDLPETKETLKFIFFLKHMEVQEYNKSIPKDSEMQTHQAENNEEQSKKFKKIVTNKNSRQAKVSNENKYFTL